MYQIARLPLQKLLSLHSSEPCPGCLSPECDPHLPFPSPTPGKDSVQTLTFLVKPQSWAFLPLFTTCASITQGSPGYGNNIEWGVGSLLGNEPALGCWGSFPITPSHGSLLCKIGIMTHDARLTTTKWENVWEASTARGTQRPLANSNRHPHPCLHILPFPSKVPVQ